MVSCTHDKLELLPERKMTLRCRHCHLTLGRDELEEGFCPECFETSGSKRYEFEEMAAPEDGIVRYRCEDCGAVIKSA
jgi:phage FluMu protein Com